MPEDEEVEDTQGSAGSQIKNEMPEEGRLIYMVFRQWTRMLVDG